MPHEAEVINEKLAVVKVSRELESGRRESVNRLRDLCREQVEKNMNLIIDFGNVNICPSLVWGNLLVLAKRCRGTGCKIALCSLRPTLDKAIRIIGITRYMEIFPSKDEALNALKQEQENG